MKKKFPQTRQVILTSGGANWLHAVVQISKTRTTNVKKIMFKTTKGKAIREEQVKK